MMMAEVDDDDKDNIEFPKGRTKANQLPWSNLDDVEQIQVLNQA
jgi:hypothetical protein